MERLLLNGNDWEFKDFVGEDWIWRNAEKRDTKDIRWWRLGQVPGCVTNDLWKLGEIPDPYFEKNSLLIEWIPQRTWIYRKKFRMPDTMKGQKITLHFEGVDYEGLFYINDILLGQHTGMYTPFNFDVTELINWDGENQISVVLQKAPDEQPQVSKTSYVKTHKSRMTYWWDFCPRMIHVGIWDDIYIEAHGKAVINNVFVRPVICENKKSANIMLETTVTTDSRCKGKLIFTIQQENDIISETVFKTELFEGENIITNEMLVQQPKLWWPNGYGEQPLYTIYLQLIIDDSNAISYDLKNVFGIREISFVANENAEPMADGYTLEVNREKIYIKGWNWVPLDVMYGVVREAKLRNLIRLAKEAHVNMLRIWGGGLIEKEAFYEMCDECGILVWQEFIQSSSGIDNKPSDDAQFLTMMKQEAQKIIPRKRNHPSLALWCGGNELQSENSSMIKNTEPVIQTLRRAVKELDPDRKFLSSSPSGRIFNNNMENIEKDPTGLHDVHGPWEHQGLVEQYTLYNSGTSLLSSEYGVEGMTNYNTLAKSMDKKNMWPPSRDNIMYFHRGSWWNNYGLIQQCFGEKINDIKTMIQVSQFLQYEGLKYAVESNRRRAFQNSGSLMWQFNEPYPNNYCTSAIDYYGQPKPVYYGIQKAYSPLYVSASFQAQALYGYEFFEAELFIHNSYEEPKDLKVEYTIAGICGEVYLEGKKDVLALGESTKISKVKLPVTHIKDNNFLFNIIIISKKGEQVSENRYLFTKDKDLSSLVYLDKTKLAVTFEKNKDYCKECEGILTIKNVGSSIAAGVKIMLDSELDSDSYAYFSDNFLYLLPGEEKKISVSTVGLGDGPIKLHFSGMGIEESTFNIK